MYVRESVCVIYSRFLDIYIRGIACDAENRVVILPHVCAEPLVRVAKSVAM